MNIDEKDISIATYAHQVVMLAARVSDLTEQNIDLKQQLAAAIAPPPTPAAETATEAATE